MNDVHKLMAAMVMLVQALTANAQAAAASVPDLGTRCPLVSRTGSLGSQLGGGGDFPPW